MAECTDIDECDMGIRFCNFQSVTQTGRTRLHCMNTVGTYKCGCRTGFEQVQKMNETYCTDVDECLNQNSCPVTSVCSNNVGSYTCECDTGYEGKSCLDYDECSGNQTCDVNALCKNTPGRDVSRLFKTFRHIHISHKDHTPVTVNPAILALDNFVYRVVVPKASFVLEENSVYHPQQPYVSVKKASNLVSTTHVTI